MQGVVVACQCPNQQWHDQIWTVMDCSYLFMIHNYLSISLLFPDISPLNFTCFAFVGEISKPLTSIDYFTISVWVVFHPPNLWGLRGIAPFEPSTGEWILNTSRGELQGNPQMAIKIKGCPGKKIYSLYIVSHWLGFYHWITSPWKKPRLWSTMWFQAPVHSDIAARLLCGWWSSWIGRWIQWLGLRETLSYR